MFTAKAPRPHNTLRTLQRGQSRTRQRFPTVSTALVLLLSSCTSPVEPEAEAGDFFILNGEQAVVSLGDSLTLKAAVRDPLPRPVDENVRWASEDPRVATVNWKGIVRMRGPGSTRITAKYWDREATFVVHTTSNATSAGVIITVEPPNLVLEPGESAALEAFVQLPTGDTLDAEVSWSSSDEDVVRVENGRVTALAVGASRIRASAQGRSGDAFVTVSGGGEGDEGGPDAFRAFPEAEGYGATALTTCDRTNVQVLKVTNTNASGTGSLREAFARADSDRLTVIVFTTGGTIESTITQELAADCVYVAGQTARGDGIQLFNPYSTPFGIPREGANDVVLRYLKFRSWKSVEAQADAGRIFGGRRIVMDHNSFQFSNDETLSVSTVNSPSASAVSDILLQHNLFAAALENHSTGTHIRSERATGRPVERVTMHHNMWSDISHRTPRIDRAVRPVQHINNVTYNYEGQAAELNGDAEVGIPHVDFIGNYWKQGPWSRGIAVMHDQVTGEGTPRFSKIYAEGNIHMNTLPDPNGNQRSLFRIAKTHDQVPDSAFVNTPFGNPAIPVTVEHARDAYENVLSQAGASRLLACDGTWRERRDELDQLFIDGARNGTGYGTSEEHTHPDYFGGLPTLARGTACTDTDRDGMPDDFEVRRGLDPQVDDASEDPDGDGYTNIEEYVNGTDPR